MPARAEPWLPVLHSSVFALQKKSLKGDVKNLILLTYLKALTVIGVMAVVLFLQLCLIHCMMVRRREAYENTELLQELAPVADKSREKASDKSKEKASDNSREKVIEKMIISWFRRIFKRKKEKNIEVKKEEVKKEPEEKRLPGEPLVPYHAPFQLLSSAELAPTQMSNAYPAPTMAPPLRSIITASSPPTNDLFMTPGDANRPPLPRAPSPGRSANHVRKGWDRKAKNPNGRSSYGWDWM
ncbi:unnamed protein product [Cylicostephanus goldi]|uniref:Uncharacterized protein n=1 Tax=Cylicostephanus goldi TaxID=71465 RepID=A0A3P6QSJ9_CYLGO|nr:unnamed protein product [Cylicostephanus goldi]